jgi:predicted DNA-binding protein
MGRPRKNGTYLNVCIDKNIYKQLEEICEEAGQTKTIAVERAIMAYLADYRVKQEKLHTIEEQEQSHSREQFWGAGNER